MNSITGIKYISLHEDSGYGNAAQSYMRSIVDAGIPLTWTPLVPGNKLKLGYQPFTGDSSGSLEFDKYCNVDIPYDAVIIHAVPEYFPYFLQKEVNKIVFGYTVWETTVIPNHWKQLLNQPDGLFVPCQWNTKVFKECGVTTDTYAIPHICEKPLIAATPPPFIVPEDHFVFYSINTWTARKSVESTLHAFLSSFTAEDPATLVIKTTAENFCEEKGKITQFLTGQRYKSTLDTLNQILDSYPNPANVILLADYLSDQEIAALHRRGDCYISLCHSEGWGLGAFEAGSHGNPVIMTGFGGQCEYLNSENSYLVNYNLTSVKDANDSYTSNQLWAEPSLDHARECLLQVFQNQEQANARGKILQNHLHKNFSRGKIADPLIQALEDKICPLSSLVV